MKPPRLTVLLDTDPIEVVRTVLNEFMRDVVSVLDRGVSVEDNMRQTFVDLDVDGGATNLRVSAPWNTRTRAAAVVYARNRSTRAADSTELPWLPDTMGGIRIASFPGLTSGTRYDVRIWMAGE